MISLFIAAPSVVTIAVFWVLYVIAILSVVSSFSLLASSANKSGEQLTKKFIQISLLLY